MTTAPQMTSYIPKEVKALKARIAEFVREELHPFEAEIAERGEIDEEKLRSLRDKAREAGFSNLNMPAEYGGMDLSMVSLVTLEEESGKVTNGLGYMVADRGPRELLELASPEQVERYVMPVLRGETREAWAITEPEAERSSDQERARSIRRSAAPQQRAAIINLSSENQRLVPSSPPFPSRAPSGTRQSFSRSSTCLEA